MEKLSIEQKAKAYDEAIKVATAAYKDEDRHLKATLERIFPELRESEDERIRKDVLAFIRREGQHIDKYKWHKWIAWLEKQQGEQKPTQEIEPTPIFRTGDILKRKSKDYTFRVDRIQGGYYHCDYNHGAFFPIEEQGNWELVEQKPVEEYNITDIKSKHHLEGKLGKIIKGIEVADKVEQKDYNSIDPHFCKPIDKVEPKFKVGDWITNGDYTWKIVEVKPLDYILQSQDGNIVDDTISHVDEQFHSFTIKDARDGDVLAKEGKDGVVLIFRGIGNAKWNDVIDYHCYYNCYRKEFIVQEELGFWGHVDDTELKPATKEQREQLEKSMADKGYMFDFEKKELTFI